MELGQRVIVYYPFDAMWHNQKGVITEIHEDNMYVVTDSMNNSVFISEFFLKEDDFNMERQIKEYVKAELGKFHLGVKSIKLEGVNAGILADLIEGWDWSEADTNGWDVDYWLKTDKYEISGNMYYGTATITLK